MAQLNLNVLVEWSSMFMVLHKKTTRKCEGNAKINLLLICDITL